MTRQFQRTVWPEDTVERIENFRKMNASWAEIATDFGCSVATVRNKAVSLGLFQPSPPRKFSPEEDAVIRADYATYVPVDETARKLNRSSGVIRQRLFHHHRDLLNSTRTGRGTRALKRYGIALLDQGATPDEAAAAVRTKLMAAKAVARVAAINASESRRDRMLTAMKEQIANGKPRNEAIFEARSYGCTLQEIASCFDITRERVRQICDAMAFEIAVRQQQPSQERVA